ncbi:hypothetical protein U9M48_034570 [Paspalum notatum var. saurae]|uniref:At1g61320/AtMIF1 LRR domain-containing protein n=1 Tax=Paspalum notatum var. saurae TaxID=547442 RepID=A0AAQ3U9F2_PASNO
MSSISARRADMDNRNCPAKKKRRLTLGLQSLNFLSLPEDIVLRITAGITLKEAVRISAVCSNLRKAWIHHPNLDFDISTVLAKGNQCSGRYNRVMDIKRFIDTVNFILREHSGFAVNRLAVKFELHKEHANDIDGWVYFAIASKARVVVLNFSPYLGPYDNYYNFPGHLFNNQNSSHLQVLQLDRVTLDPNDLHGFSNLRTLSLERVLLLQDLQYLLLKCPVLERLSICLCPELHDLYAAEPLQQLKFLCVQYCDISKIDLHAPNLIAFEYRGNSNVFFALKECLKLQTATIAFHVAENIGYVFTEIPVVLPHVETLHVEVHVNTQIHGFAKAPLRFLYLRHFSMKIILAGAKRSGKNSILQLAYILEAAPFLVDLHLDMNCGSFCEYPPKRDVIADRRHHNLKQACIIGFNGNGGQVALVKYILRNAVQLERMVIDPGGKAVVQWMREHIGRISAKSELVPRDRKGVLTIL